MYHIPLYSMKDKDLRKVGSPYMFYNVHYQ